MEHFRGFSTYIGEQTLEFGIRHTVALAQVPQRRSEFTVRAAVLSDNKFCKRRIGIYYLDRVLQFFLIYKHAQPSVFPQ